jgi:hypothetical protein
MFPGAGALMGAAGGGMSASSSSSSGLDSGNNISSGAMNIGGLTMGSSGGIDSDLIVKGAVIAALVLGGIFVWKKVK